MRRRVVVTGLGAISPVGNDVRSCWQAILAGTSGVGPITRFEASAFASRIAAEVKNFDSSAVISAKEARRMDTFIHYGIVAAEEAVLDAGLDGVDLEQAGVVIGSGIGGLPMIEATFEAYREGGPRKISPFFVPGSIINMISGNVSIRHGLKGPNWAAVSACSTGAHSIGEAIRLIEYGDADFMVAGGSEAAITPLTVGGFAAAKALSCRNEQPQQASRPWDQDRDGFVLGEGAGVLVLEELEHARRRGAKIYAECAGYGMSSDAHHITAPLEDGAGAAQAMRRALANAGLNPEQISYVNAHGTSTPLGDLAEVAAIKAVFGAHAGSSAFAMSSTKSMTGHLLGGAGGLEAVLSVLALRDQVAPPTINLDQPEPGIGIDLVAHHSQNRRLEAVLSNSFGFGGTNATLVFKRH